MSRGHAKAPSQRQLRVGEELRHALAWCLERGEVRDPGLAGRVVTVTEVRVSPDLKNATAYVVTLGGGAMDDVLEALERAQPFLRRRVAGQVRLRSMPRFAFAADTTFDSADRINALLRTPDLQRDTTMPADGVRRHAGRLVDD